MKHFLLFLYVWVGSALPLIALASYIGFKLNYNLYDYTVDLLKRRSPVVRYVLLAALVVAAVVAVLILARHV